MNIKRVIAKEGLIIIAIGILLYFFLLFFFQKVTVVFPEYKAYFADGSVYVVTIYPDIAYSKVRNPRVFLKEVHNPSPRLITQRIEQFARRANINSGLKDIRCINNWQLRLSEAYSFILTQSFPVKILFVYLVLLLARFIFWAVKTLKKR